MATKSPKDGNHPLEALEWENKIKVEEIVSYFSLPEKNVPFRLNWLEGTNSKTILTSVPRLIYYP